MSNVVDFPGNKNNDDNILAVELTDMTAIMRYSFGVEATLIKVSKDEPGATAFYGAKFEKYESGVGLICADSANAIETWKRLYDGKFFDSRASVIMCFISCLLDDHI